MIFFLYLIFETRESMYYLRPEKVCINRNIEKVWSPKSISICDEGNLYFSSQNLQIIAAAEADSLSHILQWSPTRQRHPQQAHGCFHSILSLCTFNLQSHPTPIFVHLQSLHQSLLQKGQFHHIPFSFQPTKTTRPLAW